jgi:hypothetical protein
MGLDTVELVMEFEDQFLIDIPDREAEKMQTIGDTVEFLVAALHNKQAVASTMPCVTQSAFHRLRRGLVEKMSVERRAVRPHVAVGTIVTERTHRRQWPSFARQCGLVIPRFSFRTERRFPNPERTIADLSREIGRRIQPIFLNDLGEVDASAVYDKVRSIVSEQMKVPVETLHPSTRYIQDLAMG